MGKLGDLAAAMGRTRQFICRQARTLGLTDPKAPRPYFRIWKGMPEEQARMWMDKFKQSSLTLGRFCKRLKLDDLGFSKTLSEFFPDEWDAVIESKAPRQTKYRLGRSFEYRVRDDLRRKGYFVLRSPRSGSPVDLIAVKKDKSLLFIQCKRGGAIGVTEWNIFYDLCISVGAMPILAEMGTVSGVQYWQIVERKDGTKRAQPKISIQILD
jgi:hypothetical protein